MQSEIDLLERQISSLQTELVYKKRIVNMQVEMNLLKMRITELETENTKLKNIVIIEKQNEITDTNKEYYISDSTNQQLSSVYPSYIQFIINHISSWPENSINKANSKNLYQEYLTWCEINNKEPLDNNILGKKFAQIGIDRSQVRIGGKREWHHILDRSKIMNKIHELFDRQTRDKTNSSHNLTRLSPYNGNQSGTMGRYMKIYMMTIANFCRQATITLHNLTRLLPYNGNRSKALSPHTNITIKSGFLKELEYAVEGSHTARHNLNREVSYT
ncbi:hypothetical protein Glove_74g169 [Diversispora epigaea]|nr:hypothetical protein Glove_74g169 [Diversispora epigaea]